MTQAAFQLFDALPAHIEDALRASIDRFGVLVPVTVDQHGTMLDGHHRARIADELSVPYDRLVRYCDDDDERHEIARTLNSDRRQLSEEQRRAVVVDLREKGHSLRAIAGALGVGKSTIERDLEIVPAGTISQPDRVIRQGGGSYPARRPQVMARNDREVRRAEALLESAPHLSGDLASVDLKTAAREVRIAAKRAAVAEIEARTTVPLDSLGPFPVLYADPPWRYEHSETTTREIENQYPTMPLDEIKKLDVPAADDAVLFLWVTSPKLVEGIDVMEAWGFEYRTCMVWVKDRIGMGYYARQQHELLLIGKRGGLPVPDPEDRPSSVITADRGEHSAKPDEVYALIERMYPLRERCELFQRRPRDGWAGWGNQAGEA